MSCILITVIRFIGKGMYKACIAGDNAFCAFFAGMRGRLFGALCGTGPGGEVHRDMTSIIGCIPYCVIDRDATSTSPSEQSPPPHTSWCTTSGASWLWLFWKLGAVGVTKRRNSSVNWLAVGHGRSHRCPFFTAKVDEDVVHFLRQGLHEFFGEFSL